MNNSFISYTAAVYLRLSKEDEDLRTVKDKKESNSIANQILSVLALGVCVKIFIVAR